MNNVRKKMTLCDKKRRKRKEKVGRFKDIGSTIIKEQDKIKNTILISIKKKILSSSLHSPPNQKPSIENIEILLLPQLIHTLSSWRLGNHCPKSSYISARAREIPY